MSNNQQNDGHHQIEHPENDAQYTGLQVNAGIEMPPMNNPYMKRRNCR